MKKILTLFLDNPVQIKLTNQMYSSKDENKYKLKIKSNFLQKLIIDHIKKFNKAPEKSERYNMIKTNYVHICIIKRKKHVTAEME
ncbi:hypothetical protein T12_6055 [Trichinella patagoniensis]|uniref:Uncharacterized protein n=1 Tax=Trichinella patagoniensis TaxID=990121 RepID=A0A0V1AEN2_9BILA|nr:hypothetical protein T12_6055 [Trichinella patagoniensis]